MSDKLKLVKEQRGMGFLKKGMKVYQTYSKKWGTIVNGNCSGNIDVKFENEKGTSNCHPQWRMQYFDESDKIIAEYKD